MVFFKRRKASLKLRNSLMKLFVSVWPFADFPAAMYDDKKLFRKGKITLIFRSLGLRCSASLPDETFYWVYKNQRFRLARRNPFFLYPYFRR